MHTQTCHVMKIDSLESSTRLSFLFHSTCILEQQEQLPRYECLEQSEISMYSMQKGPWPITYTQQTLVKQTSTTNHLDNRHHVQRQGRVLLRGTRLLEPSCAGFWRPEHVRLVSTPCHIDTSPSPCSMARACAPAWHTSC